MPRSPVPPGGRASALTPPLWRPDADGGCGFGARLPYAKGGGVREISEEFCDFCHKLGYETAGQVPINEKCM
jgi:hypothetical protein